MRRRRDKKEMLPGGLMLEVCRALQELPGPRSSSAMEWIRSQVEAGVLRRAESFAYYLEALEEEGLLE